MAFDVGLRESGASFNVVLISTTYKQALLPIKNLLSLNQANCSEDGTTTGWDNYNAVSVNSVTTTPYQGSRCIEVVSDPTTNPSGIWTNTPNRITTGIVGETYTFSAYITKTSGTTQEFYLSFYALDSELSTIEEAYILYTVDTGWTRREVSLTLPANTVYMEFLIGTHYTGDTITFRVDAAQLERGSFATAFELPSPTTSVLLTPTYQSGGIYQNISASLTFTPSLLRVPTYWRTISANSTFTATLSRALTLGRILLANATFTTAILRNGYKTLSANATFTVTLSRLITAYRSISASLASTVSIGALKSKFVTLSASLASTVSLVNGLTLNRTLSVTEAPSPSLSRVATLYRTLSASSTFTSVLDAIKQAGIIYQNVSATATFTVSIVRQMYRTISVSGTFTVIISRAITIYRTISSNATFTVAISKITTTLRTLSANATFTVGVVKSLTIYRVLSVVETAAVSLSRTLSMKRTLSVTEEPVPTLSRFIQIQRAFSNVVSFITNLLYVKNPIPPEYPCVNLDCHLTPSETLDCHLTPSVSIDCETGDKEINLNCSLRCN